MSKRLSITFYILFLWSSLHAQSFSSPKREVRAVWLTTIGGLDWPHSYAQSSGSIERQQQELSHLLDLYQQAGINTVLLQTRIRGTVIYPSQYEPWDGCLSGVPGRSPGYDALRFAIDECHRRGMELHAWVVTIPIGKWDKLGVQNIRRKLPGVARRIGPEGYMNPENPRTASYLADICEEITRNYDVDGIHLDYIRYPETWNIKVSRDQGRNYITGIVRAISQRVKSLKPWVKMSCSPIGKFDDLSRYWSHGWNAYTKVCQDAQGWLRSGLMDQLYPMMYFRDNQFFPFAIDWAEQSDGKTIAPGLGIYFLNPKEGNWRLADVTREMEVLRQYGMGQTFFRGKFLTDNDQGIYDFVKRFNRHPALVPAMTWASHTLPEEPASLQMSKKGLSWQGHTPYYNVYSSRTWPVDVSRAENLIAVRRTANSIALPTDGRYFAVTGMDRFGNESKALQSHQMETAPRIDIPLLACDGRRLTLPPKDHTLDAQLLTIETLQGSIVDTRTYQGKTIDVSRLPNGYYVLRSLGRKGVTHRLGFFQVKRGLPHI
ncbi:MAG: family 10 glycosylhydrolase [Prevotella sp.]|nr:family 10 glycosylhydrolase [Prevotella sp.]